MGDSGTTSVLYFGDQWDDLWRRRQQLALHVSRMPDVAAVLYVELPLTLTSLVRYAVGHADRDAVARWRRVLRHGTVFRHEGVTIVTPIVPFRLYSGAAASAWNARAAWPQVRRAWARVSKRAHVVVWAGHPYAGLFLDRTPRGLLCYDYTEDFTRFASFNPACRALFAKLDQRLVESADVVFTQTDAQLREKRVANPHAHPLPNAADIPRLLAGAGQSPPPEMAPLQRPIIGLVGSLSYRVDVDMLAYAAERRPTWSFVLIGAVEGADIRERLARFQNMHFLGPKPYVELGKYVPFFDVGLIPYKLLPEMGDPLKMYDYFAFGKPVVSTPFEAVKGLGDWLYLARSPDAFIMATERALREDNASAARRRREFALEQSWEQRARTAWDILRKRRCERSQATDGS